MTHIMSDIVVTINGIQYTGQEGTTILNLAQENEINIPTLCHRTEFTPIGACRMCVVEVEGSRTLVGSCHTPIGDGMVIHTHSPVVLDTRRTIVELLLASHSGTCYMCDKANICELRAIATDLDIGLSQFPVRKRYYQIEDGNPYIIRDLTKCILCRRCVWACREVANKDLFAVGYRGFASKIVVDIDQPLDKEACNDCGICIPFCPTGALGRANKTVEKKEGKPLIVKG